MLEEIFFNMWHIEVVATVDYHYGNHMIKTQSSLPKEIIKKKPTPIYAILNPCLQLTSLPSYI